jgi:hypothetical protein
MDHGVALMAHVRPLLAASQALRYTYSVVSQVASPERKEVDASLVDRKLADLQSHFRQVKDAIDRLEQGLTVKREEYNWIAAQIEVLQELQSASVPKPEVSGSPRLRPSEAVRLLLAKQPGLTTVEILNELEDAIDTAAANRRHILRTTLFNMKKALKLKMDEMGRYSLAEH